MQLCYFRSVYQSGSLSYYSVPLKKPSASKRLVTPVFEEIFRSKDSVWPLDGRLGIRFCSTHLWEFSGFIPKDVEDIKHFLSYCLNPSSPWSFVQTAAKCYTAD